MDEPKIPTWFKVWFAIVGVLAVGLVGLVAWALIAFIGKLTR